MSGLMNKPAGEDQNGSHNEDIPDWMVDTLTRKFGGTAAAAAAVASTEFDPKTYMQSMKKMADELSARDARIMELLEKVRKLEGVQQLVSNAGMESELRRGALRVSLSEDLAYDVLKVMVVFQPTMAEVRIDAAALRYRGHSNEETIALYARDIAEQLVRAMPNRMTATPMSQGAPLHSSRMHRPLIDPNIPPTMNQYQSFFRNDSK